MKYPKRHKTHIQESASERFVKYHFPREWTFNKPNNDYGIDLICEVIINNEVKGYDFGIQLKSKIKETSNEFVHIKGLKRTTINYWLNSLKPIMIIVFISPYKTTCLAGGHVLRAMPIFVS